MKVEIAGRLVVPVTVAATGEQPVLRGGPALRRHDRVVGRVTTEDGTHREGRLQVRDGALELPFALPEGYHRIEVHAEGGGDEVGGSGTIIVAPRQAFGSGDADGSVREWGCFLPLHALRARDDRGVGDLGGLERLLEWVDGLGGGAVGVLPLLAGFGAASGEVSPYAPMSRLFWNELFLDLGALPEATGARSTGLDAPDDTRLVDYEKAYELLRSALIPLVERWHREGGDRSAEFRAFLGEQPEAPEYARFRAAIARSGQDWTSWPTAWRSGGIPASAMDSKEYRFHLYVQQRFREQLRSIAEGRGGRAGLYLDLPLGAHPGGYDVWVNSGLFAEGVGLGAPPDSFHSEGQDWGLAPIRPRESRASGHAHFRAVVRESMRYARWLRIDHVMGLHRQYWVPAGVPADAGVYVRHPAEELHAILRLESHRAGTMLVGEDLGTVPAEVRRTMDARGIRRMFVVPFEVEAERGLRSVPEGAVASLNTHDLATFATTWKDPGVRDALAAIPGVVLPPEGDDALPALGAILSLLGRSRAGMVMVNLEDLWLEEEQQNSPGGAAAESWRRRARLSFEEFMTDFRVLELLRELDRSRAATGGTDEDPTTEGAVLEGDSEDVDAVREGRLTAEDLYLFNEGRHFRLYRTLGAHLSGGREERGVDFAVWAPAAEAVSVVGNFNGWDPRAHPLRPRGASGIWEGRVPEAGKGDLYKYAIRSQHGGYRAQKADPFGFRHEVAPATASVVWDLDFEWGDGEWMEGRSRRNAPDAPISVYEVHLGSWRRDPADPARLRGYRELAPELADWVKTCGFTHVQLLPLTEHPFYGSWGYQTTGYFAPTSRYGAPQDLMFLIDHLHQEGIGVILDWVPSHFPSDEHGLGYFDGTHLFEHADPRQGFHPDWESLIFNYGRNEVRSFLVSSALFWLEHYHVDALRVDAVASMLYLDYSRNEGEWIPNRHGGRENLEAIDFLRTFNEEVYSAFPDVQTIAEESTAWPMVSRPTWLGGLGFGMKWDMGWMHDTLRYFSKDPVHRRHHHHELTFRALYAFNENFMLPLSHDEVVHGKGSLLSGMPGDEWRKRANLRLLLALQFLQPGKKLLFMGGELGQWGEWDHDGSLEWHLLDNPAHAGIRRVVTDLNRLYRQEPALHRGDFLPGGFEWIVTEDSENSVLAFLRKDPGTPAGQSLVAVFNLTPVPRENYRIGVPGGGRWTEVLNTDAEVYGGSGWGNQGGVDAVPIGSHGRFHSLVLSLPPLGAVVFRSPDGDS
ncbi:MAG: 1,4-alpha-glucan branching protein GlgB [Gemmatimonadota bacterium]